MLKYLFFLLLISSIAFSKPNAPQVKWQCKLPSECLGLAFTHDDKYVVARAYNDSTYVIDASTGVIVRSIPGGNPFSITIDNKYIYHYSNADSTFVKVSLSSGNVVQTMQKDSKLSYYDYSTVSEDCKYGASLYAASNNSNADGWRVWDLESGNIILDHPYLTDSLNLMKVSAGRFHFLCNTTHFILGETRRYNLGGGSHADTNTYVEYNYITGDSILSFPCHLGAFNVNHSCTKYAESTLSTDTAGIIVYDLKSHTEISRMNLPGQSVSGKMLFSAKDTFMIVPSDDSILYICNVNDGKVVYCPGSGACYGLCVNSDVSLIPVYTAKVISALISPVTSVGIKSDNTSNELVYPNPATSILTIASKILCEKPSFVSFVNEYGQSVSLQAVCDDVGRWIIDVSMLQNGVYSLALQNGDSKNTYKMIINR